MKSTAFLLFPVIAWLSPLNAAPVTNASPVRVESAKVKVDVLESQEKVRLKQVTVSATRTERLVENTPGSVDVFGQDDFNFNQPVDARDLLRYETDVSVPFSPGASSSVSPRNRSGSRSINIRGIEGNRVLLHVDGVRQPDEYNFGGVYNIGRDYIDMDSLKRVEVLKGSASALYGSDAIGGVVSFTTKDPQDFLSQTPHLWFFGFKQGFESANMQLCETVTTAFETSKDSGEKGPKAQFLFLYTRRDYQETQNEGNFPANPEQDDSNNFLGKVRIITDALNQTVLTTEYLKRNQDAHLDSVKGRLLPSPTRINNSINESETKRFRASLGHEFKDSSGDLFFDGLQAQAYVQPSKVTETSYEAVQVGAAATGNRTRVRGGDFKEDMLGGSLQLQSGFDFGQEQSHRLTYGADASITGVSRDRTYLQTTLISGATSVTDPTGGLNPLKEIPDTDVLRYGLFSQDEITLGGEGIGQIVIIPGLRYDAYTLQAKNSPLYMNASRGVSPAGFQAEGLSPKLGILGKVTEETTLYGQYAKGFRNPTPEDINGAILNTGVAGPPYRTLPNPDLRAEQSHSFEMGVRGNHPGLIYSQALYYNDYQNFIVTFANAGTSGGFTLYQSRNLTEAEIMGFESKAEIPLGHYYGSLEGLSLMAAAALSKGEDMDYHQPLSTVEPFKFVGSVRYTSGPLQTEFVSTFRGSPNRLPDSGPNSLSTGSQFIPPASASFDLITSYAVNDHAALHLGLYNLTNESYWLWSDVRGIEGGRYDIDRYTQPGFNVKATLTVKF